MKIVNKSKITIFLSFNLKLIVLSSLLFSQLSLFEIFLYRNNPDVSSINIAKANTSDTWYNTGGTWNYRDPVTITNQVAQALGGYQVKLNIDTAALVSAGKIQSDGRDIRFADTSGINIPYWIESGMNTGSTIIWIKIDLGLSEAKAIYMYYGNSGAIAVSDGSGVFDFFDDFNTFSGYTQETWSGNGCGTWSFTAANSELRCYGTFPSGGGCSKRVRKTVALSSGTYIQRTKYRIGSSTVGVNYWTFRGDEPNTRRNTTLLSTVNEFSLGAGTSFDMFVGAVGWTGGGTGDYYVDWMVARKYAAIEPSVAFGSLNTNWTYRETITITNNVAQDLSGYQLKLTTNTATLISAGKMKSDGSDIRFADTSGVDIPYWIESGINTSSTIIWIKANLTSSTAKIIYMHYGNGGASAVSDGSGVFDFFDDFNGYSGYTQEAWDPSSNCGTWSFTNASSELRCYGTFTSGGCAQRVRKTTTLSSGTYIQRTKYRITSSTFNINYWTFRGDEPNHRAGVSVSSMVNEFSLGAGTSFNMFVGATGWTGAGTGEYYVDWMAARKYAAIEPSITFGLEETSTPPVLTQVISIPTHINFTTPSYTFNSSKAGAISYPGGCSSSITNAIAGDNTITFNALSEGLHNDCTIKVTDGFGNQPTLSVNSFTVDATPPSAFALLSPLSNASISTKTPTFSWNSSSDSSSIQKYQLYLDGVMDRDNLILTNTTSSTELSCGDHNWSVRAFDNAGNATSAAVSNFSIGCSGGFVSPIKPIVTLSDLTGGNPPANITQLAVSDTSDFKNISWEDISKKDELLKQYANTNKLYLKFRTKDGGVSDVLIFTNKISVAQSPSITLSDGDIVKTLNSPDVYIIKMKNNKQYKRLILSPQVFKSYGHLKWSNLKIISQMQMDSFVTSSLVQVAGDSNLYELTPLGDTGERKVLDISSSYDADSVYEINAVDRDSYKLVK